AAPHTATTTVEMSLAAAPHLRDHQLFRQRDGWPDEEDFRPVVPASGLIDSACRAVEKTWPGLIEVGVYDPVSLRWLVGEAALLDNVGRLLRCWLMGTQTDGLPAFPRSIGRITWYGPEPGPAVRVSALATIRLPRPDLVEMDAEVVHDGRVVVRIERWQDV